MKIRIEMIEAGDTAVEVLVINGGAESVAGVLSEVGQAIEAEVAAPQAVVLREKP